MMDNNINFSNSNSSNNNSSFTDGGQSGNNIPDLIQLPILSLTIIFAIGYTILVLVRPTFRHNKLNWFTINLCLMSVLLSLSNLIMSIKRMKNELDNSLPCRLQAFLIVMTSSQLMYSHSVISISRLLTIVYGTKRIFRSTKCIWICLGFGWIIAILVCIPFLLVDAFTCSDTPRENFLQYYTLAVVLVLPVFIVLVCNIWILLYVRQSSRRVHTEGSRGEGVSHARDIRLLKTMIVTFTVFVGGWMPLCIVQTFNQSIQISSIASSIFQILPSLSMLSDVILLIYINQPIRLFLYQVIFHRHQVVEANTLNNTINTRAIIIK